MSATICICDGDLLDQKVDVIVNAWNRNALPAWLLIPQGVSRAIKKQAGPKPFAELAKKGLIPLGGAVETTAGKLPFKAIIHVAGINLFWRSSEQSIRLSVRNALQIAFQKKYRSIAFPLVGSGTGGFSPNRALELMQAEIVLSPYDGEVRIVRFVRSPDLSKSSRAAAGTSDSSK
jgi:O-acetyl-ADP-ribose deacetylase